MANPNKPLKQTPQSNPSSPASKAGIGAGRPRRNRAARFIQGYKTAATGETRNSPYTDPNIIFWVGIALIILAGWSSGRLKTIAIGAWQPSPDATANWLNALKSTFAQFVFLFLLVVMARAIPPLARVFLVIMLGSMLLWLIKNPQIMKALADLAKSSK